MKIEETALTEPGEKLFQIIERNVLPPGNITDRDRAPSLRTKVRKSPQSVTGGR